MNVTESELIAARAKTPFAVQTATVIAFVIGWQSIGRAGSLLAELFPPITEILKSLLLYVTSDSLLPHVIASLYEILGGLAIGALFGIPRRDRLREPP